MLIKFEANVLSFTTQKIMVCMQTKYCGEFNKKACGVNYRRLSHNYNLTA